MSNVTEPSPVSPTPSDPGLSTDSALTDRTPRVRATSIFVHAYTASGAVLALLMVHFAYQGETAIVLWLFLAAMFIDGTDGFLARWARVKQVHPGFDGSLLDNIVDYMTYALAPMALLLTTGHLPSGAWGLVVASIPLLASCYQFCRTDAKTDDHYFLGFPSYWNIVAFYVIALDLSPAVTTATLLVLCVMVFVPIKYLYPSRTEILWPITMAITSLWFVAFAAIVATLPNPPLWLVLVSLAYPVYYTAVSGYLTVRRPN